MVKSAEEFGQYLQNFIDRHREDLSILLRSHGIEAEPTPALLVALYNEYGGEFVEALTTLNYSGYEDEPWLGHSSGTTTATAPDKKNVFDSIANFFTKGTELISKVGGSKSIQTPQAPAQPGGPNQPASSTKKIIIIGASIVVLLIIIFIIIKNRKK